MSASVAYVRLFADAQGNSHLEQDLALELTPTNFVPPAPSIYVSALQPATACAFLSVPEGYFGDWHPSPKRKGRWRAPYWMAQETIGSSSQQV